MHNKVSYFCSLCLALAGIAGAGAQVIQNPANGPLQNPANAAVQTPQAPPDAPQLRPTYVLGPGDQMIIRAQNVEEIDQKAFLVDQDGTLPLPLIGAPIKAAGRTIAQLEADIADRLKTLVRNPVVNITMIQFRRDIVYLRGQFVKPGLWPLDGRTTLAEMMAKAGGLTASASRTIRLTRKMENGPIPLPGVIEDREARVSTVDIGLGSLTDTVNPAEDIVLVANDEIVATKAEKVYVEGAFVKVGTLDLEERDSLSAMQVVILSGGFAPDAQPSKAQILRPVLNTARRAIIPIDLKQVMLARANDYPLLPNDVLFVPSSKSHLKSVGKVLQIAGPMSFGLIFYILSRY
jgi:polysaccharide export outer membrane protein